MSKVKAFLDYYEEVIKTSTNAPSMSSDAEDFLDSLYAQAEKENNKPLFTATGFMILEFLQENYPEERLNSKEIAEKMGLTSRKVSGAIRKLVTDNYVKKAGTNPVSYALTDQGKNFNIKNYKESMLNEEDC